MALGFGNTAATPSTLQSVSRVKKADEAYILPFVTPASVAINAGDLLVYNTTSGYAAPISTVAWDTNLLTTQEDALTVFLGVALGSKDSVDARTGIQIPVCTMGIAGFPCAALGAAKNPGTGVAPAAQGTTNLSDFLVAVATNQLGTFGVLVVPAASGATELIFFFQSSLLYGQLQAA